MKRIALLGALFLGAAFAQQAPQKSDWEIQYEEKLREQRLQEEGIKTLPAFPKADNLVEFEVSARTDFRFFVDAASLTVEDGVVRYTVVARSPSGVDNIAYEALRCDTRQYRMYAAGRPDGSWSVRLTPWREYPRVTATSWQHALAREYWCIGKNTVLSAAEAVHALRNGGHPYIKGRQSPN